MATTRPAVDAGEPTIATNIATPTARDACRIMLTTPEPVANEDGGKAPPLTPIRVGNVRPTPMPVGIMPMTMIIAFGSGPIARAYHANPVAMERMPAAMTGAAPKREMSLPENSSDVTGTRRGPGAIASPVIKADHPHAACSHKATESSIAPKAAEYGAITSEAPVNCGMRKRAGSTNGIGDRKQRHTNSARRTIAAATATLILGELHPQSFTFTIANTSAPMPPVTSAASHALGLGAS